MPARPLHPDPARVDAFRLALLRARGAARDGWRAGTPPARLRRAFLASFDQAAAELRAAEVQAMELILGTARER